MRQVMIRLLVLGWVMFVSWGGVQESAPAQEAPAHVESEHQPRLRNGFEQLGAVPPPLPRAIDLAHEPGLEQRPQCERHRRLGDADPP